LFFHFSNTMKHLLRIPLLISASFSLALVVGCGGFITPSSSSGGGSGGGSGNSCTPAMSSNTPVSCPVRTPVAGLSFSGNVFANSQPLGAASVELYAAGNAGNGSTPTALLSAPLNTAVNGAFTVPAGYICPSAQTPLYLLSKGGQFGSGPTNPATWLMAALGPCSGIVAGSNFVVNEATTIAATWALASFMSSGGNVGASCTNTNGLDNAFSMAGSMVNPATGTSPGTGIPSTLAVPTRKLNSLADVLASCTGSGGANCSTLFANAITGNTIPTNTLDAALNIAHAPGKNTAPLYSLAAAFTAFSPALTSAPPDWMLHNTISGGGMASPASVSVAASGNIWVSSYFDSISEFTPSGSTPFPSGITGSGINQSYGMALDPLGNVWIANEQSNLNSGNGNLTELNSSAAPLATGIVSGGINFPIAVAADPNGNIWVADYGDSAVSLFSNSGSPLSPETGWGASSLEFPVAVAVDSGHNAWVANQAGALPVTKISSDGSQVTNYQCDCDGASGIATDQSGNVWIANFYGNSISEVNTCGTLILDAVSGGGINHPQAIAIDGAGTVWVANYLNSSISEITGASSASPGSFTSPSTGFGKDANLLQPYGLAIDASGNVWVSNFGSNTLTQFLGIATPVKTPMAGPPQQP